MSTAQQCSKCGAEENLGQPFFEGLCGDCCRKKAGVLPPQYATMRDQAKPPQQVRWTGPQFIARGGLLSLLSFMAGCAGGVTAGEDAGIASAALGFVAAGLMFWAFIMFAVGVIRWAVDK